MSQAFSLGWNVGLLYMSRERPVWGAQVELPERLPSPSRFSEAERSLIRLGQVKRAIDRIGKHFPPGEGEEDLLAAAGRKIEALIPKGPEVGGNDPRVEICQAHLALAQALSAGDARLARAYHLGCDLAFTCRAPDDLAALKKEFRRTRIARLGESLADLASLFPDHASRAVRLSCAEWHRWVENPKITDAGALGGIKHAGARALGKSRDISWEKDGPTIQQSLVRQGEIWRALLAGEKLGPEMLELQDYFATGARALKNAMRLLRGVWIPMLIALLLLAVGSWLLIKNEGAAATAAGLVTVGGSIGITWKGIFGGLGPVVAKIQGPVWGAALDEEIAAAITCLPAGAQEVPQEAKVAAPASGPQPDALVEAAT